MSFLSVISVFKTRRGKLDLREVDVVRRRFARYVRPYWKSLALALAATLGAVAMQLASPWPLGFIFDIVLADEMPATRAGAWFSRNAPDTGSALMVICAFVVLIAIGEACFCYLRDVITAQTGQSVVGKIRQSLFRHMQRLSPDVFETRRAGDLLVRLTGDIQMLRQMMVNAWITAGENILRIVLTIAIMFWLNPLLAAVSTATLPLVFWSTVRISRRIRHAADSQRAKEGVIASIAHEVLGAITLVQAFNREKIEQERFARQNRSSIRAGVRATRLEAKLFRIISLSSALGLCVVLYIGVNSVLTGVMSSGELLIFIGYLRAMNKPLRKLSKLASQTAKATTCGMRVAEILQIPPAVTDAPDAAVAKDIRGAIELDEVSFTYPDGTPALSKVSLKVAAGQRVAVVGPSGAGKSTLMKLLLRFYDPASGRILMDGTDIRGFTLTSLRDQIAVVQQDTVLFGLTVAENIALGCDEIDKSAVRKAAKAVGAHEFIKSLPDGYDTALAERGATLSGGQRQRIALARAMMRQSPILILDEPVTGLDAQAAQSAEATWMTNGSRRTTFVICHDLTAMERFDKVVVLDQGRVIDAGAHDELAERCEVYVSLNKASTFRSESPYERTGGAPC